MNFTVKHHNANACILMFACSLLMVVYLTDIERQRENTFNAI